MYDQLFSLQEEVFKTLANQKRLEILQLLSHGELAVSDMVNMLGMTQANASQHLSLLRRHQLVATRKQGLQVYYRLGDSRVNLLMKTMRSLLRDQYSNETTLNLDDTNVYPIVIDPVCRMRLGVGEAAAHSEYESCHYYFCAEGCHAQFAANPAHYHSTKEVLHG